MLRVVCVQRDGGSMSMCVDEDCVSYFMGNAHGIANIRIDIKLNFRRTFVFVFLSIYLLLD